MSIVLCVHSFGPNWGAAISSSSKVECQKCDVPFVSY